MTEEMEELHLPHPVVVAEDLIRKLLQCLDIYQSLNNFISIAWIMRKWTYEGLGMMAQNYFRGRSLIT